MKRLSIAIMACLFLMTNTAAAATYNSGNSPDFVNADFLTSAKLEKGINSEDGSIVYTLSKTETMSQNLRSNETNHKTDSLILVADNAAAAEEIEQYLASVRVNNSNYREGDYLGSSVSMYSTVYFSTRTISGKDFPAMKITSVNAGLTVSNGTQSKGWTMRIVQNGSSVDGTFISKQIQNYNLYGGSNPRTITPPSGWKEIIMEPTGSSSAGANTYCQVSRPGGSSQSYILENPIL